jgi:hypothetical protein
MKDKGSRSRKDKAKVIEETPLAPSSCQERGWLKRAIALAPAIIAIGAIIGNGIQCRSHLAENTRYLQQQTPQLNCDYKLNSRKDQLGFSIRNVGLIDAHDVWANEAIFMIVDGQVYEGPDVPRFNYLVCNSSRLKMWDLRRDVDAEQSIALPGLQAKAFESLMERYKTDLVSKWTISYSSPASGKRYAIEEYFLHTLSERLPKRLTDTVGGQAIRNRIDDYQASGPKHEIRIFVSTEDFELDAPINYLVMKDYSIQPLHPWTRLSVEEIRNALLWTVDFVEPEIADDTQGSVQYIWKCTDGRWSKLISCTRAFVATKSSRTLTGCLTPQDAERVKRDPTILGDQILTVDQGKDAQGSFFRTMLTYLTGQGTEAVKLDRIGICFCG